MTPLEIKRIRKEFNHTQAEFGKMLGVSLRAVQMWESGSRNISKSALKLLEEKLKLSNKKGVIIDDSKLFEELSKYSDSTIMSYIYANKDRFKKQLLYKAIEENAISLYKANMEKNELKEMIDEIISKKDK